MSDDPFCHWADKPRAPKHERAEGAVRRASASTAGVPLKSAVRRHSLGVSTKKLLVVLLASVCQATCEQFAWSSNGHNFQSWQKLFFLVSTPMAVVDLVTFLRHILPATFAVTS